jgi:hypothetical protein
MLPLISISLSSIYLSIYLDIDRYVMLKIKSPVTKPVACAVVYYRTEDTEFSSQCALHFSVLALLINP